MPLILSLSHPRGLGGRETRALASGSLSIGRLPGNDWVLPDPDRHLSKTHCCVTVEGGRYVLTDLSTNGVFHNGARAAVGRDKTVRLADGDEFRLGEFVVAVTEVPEGAELDEPAPRAARPVPPTDPFGATPPARAAAARLDPFADPLGDDPLGDPLESPFEPVTPPFPVSARGDGGRGIGGAARQDPFDRVDEESRRPTDALDDLFHGVTPAESWQGPSQADDADAPSQAFRPPPVISPPRLGDLDFDALLGDTPPGTAPEPAPAPESSPAAATATPPPPTPAAPPPPAHPAAPSPAPRPEASAGLRAFLAGAGMADLATGGQDAETALHAAGAVFREMVEGLRGVLMSRSAVKSEFRVERTMLRARDNNALKFSVTPEEALTALLAPERRGYLPPLRAAREAFDDLRSHELAVMAGVQTALVGLLRRFDPATLELRLQPGMLDAVLPLARRARTWELFRATYAEIAREAEDDFHTVFGREFARAYDAQARGGRAKDDPAHDG